MSLAITTTTPTVGQTLAIGDVVTDVEGSTFIVTEPGDAVFLTSDDRLAAWFQARRVVGSNLDDTFWNYRYGLEIVDPSSIVAHTVRGLAAASSDVTASAAAADWRTRYERLSDDYETFRGRVVEVGEEYARRNNWCSEYDRAMQEIGLPGRERTYYVEVTVTHSFRLPVTATSADDAAEIAGDMSWRDMRPTFDDCALYSVDDVSIGDVDDD
jgi:hypothetical protein